MEDSEFILPGEAGLFSVVMSDPFMVWAAASAILATCSFCSSVALGPRLASMLWVSLYFR